MLVLAPALAHAEDAANLKDADVAPKKVKLAEATQRTTEMCIDEEIAERLAVKRKRRGAVDRLFVKQGRHELTAGGGYYASDLLSGENASDATPLNGAPASWRDIGSGLSGWGYCEWMPVS